METPTPNQIKARNKAWADALLSSKKARHTLCEGEARCCLGVAMDVAHKLDPSMLSAKDYSNGADNNMPNQATVTFFGWGQRNPILETSMKEAGRSHKSAMALNDGCSHNPTGISHREIAQCVLRTFVEK